MDRTLISRSVAEIDRVLEPGGFLAITDFDTKQWFKRDNKHNSNVPTYKRDYGKLFEQLGYVVVEKTTYSHDSELFSPDIQERISTQILYKEQEKDTYLYVD